MTDDRRFYVYLARHPITGDPVYVGKGKGKRIRQHNAAALSGRHCNPALQRTIQKYGPLEFNLITSGLTEAEAFDHERALIAQYGRVNDQSGTLYNLTAGGDGTSGAIYSEETRAIWRQQRTGRRHTEEAKAKVRAAKLGKRKTPEQIEACRRAAFARMAKPGARERLSAAAKASPKAAAVRQGIAERRTGKPLTPEHRRKLSDANRRRYSGDTPDLFD